MSPPTPSVRPTRSYRWGYQYHDRDRRDVVDRDSWDDAERWAVDEALGYARVMSQGARPETAHRGFLDAFEAMLDGFLHAPLDEHTATETVQTTEQATLVEVADE